VIPDRYHLRIQSCLCLVLAICFICSGCGYHVAGHNSTLPKNIHTIAVPAFENKTTSYRIEQRLTAATVHEFIAKTRYRIISDANGGDAILRGKVVSLEVLPLIFESSTPSVPSNVTRATTMLVTMKCEVTLEDHETGKILYHTDNFIFRNQYEISTDVKSFFEEQDPAIDRMAADFAARLVAAVTENY
jgi:outer membrane lipopolysaccharide assembly protein LptE/RlpB